MVWSMTLTLSELWSGGILFVACEWLFCILFYSAVVNFIEQHMNVKFWLKFHSNPTETHAILQTACEAKALSHAELWWFKYFLRALRGCGRSPLQWTTKIYLQWKFGGSMCNLLTADCQVTLRMMVIEVNMVEVLITSTFGTWVALGWNVPAHTSVNWNGIVVLSHSPY